MHVINDSWDMAQGTSTMRKKHAHASAVPACKQDDIYDMYFAVTCVLTVITKNRLSQQWH